MAAVHATRCYRNQANELSPRVLRKLNALRRDCLLIVVKEEFPQIYPLVWQLYSSPSKLFFGDSIVQSATGVQQGYYSLPMLTSQHMGLR